MGTICFFNFSADNLKAEIGYELLPVIHGKGIMQKAISKVIEFAAKHIGLNSIKAYTHMENQSSTKLLENFNFKKKTVDDHNLMIFTLTINS